MSTIICSRPECQTTAGCQCNKPFGVNFTWGHVKDLQTAKIRELEAEIARLRARIVELESEKSADGNEGEDICCGICEPTCAERALRIAQQEGDST